MDLVYEFEQLNDMFKPHHGSDVCGVCYAVETLRRDGPSAITKDFLWGLFDTNVPQNEMDTILSNHGPADSRIFDVPGTRKAIYEAVNSIRKVDVVLEMDGQWPALKLQEYKRDDMLEEETHDSDVLRPLPDSELRMTFRHSAEDDCMLLPCLGRNGDARPVRPFLDPDLIKSWIQQCKDNHTLCSHQRRALFPLDLILIDTENESILDVAPGTTPAYLALSYTWGGVSQPKLTKAARGRMRVKGGLTSLRVPQTILDAIHLAKLIGYRYLWVDALCIVQDDSTIRHHQIAQMYDIYHSADVTIVAAGGSDCSEAVPGVRSERKLFQDQAVHDIPDLPLMKLPASTKYSIERSKWKTRGWTFQEELCSQRLLVLLPGRAVFTCPSALYREDIYSEGSYNSQDPRGSREGLTLLSVTIRSLENASREQQIALFQDLVKEYMHRSFSRDDDMENAFAGVSRMLEPVIGPSYHGIPGKHFADIIHGSWFWETSLVRRRHSFPSWSWVGWIYRPEQADVGIRAIAGQEIVLQFYRWEAGIQILGHSARPVGALSNERLPIFKQFVPNEEKVHAKFRALKLDSNAMAHLIAFTASCATLNLRAPLHQAHHISTPMTREYQVVHPGTGKRLTSIRLRTQFVANTGKSHLFIVIAYDKSRDSFRLMLIAHPRTNPQVVERINVTVQSRLVRADDWMSVRPRKSIFFMA